MAAGAPADVTVLPSVGVNELERGGLVAPNSRLEVGSVGVGVGIKAGTPRPKIGTPDEFRDTLLAAKSLHMPTPPVAAPPVHISPRWCFLASAS